MSPHIESVERYLLRIVPKLAAEWQGAREEEIARIQALTPHPLPQFYVWFLRRMGRSMGPMAFPLVDFSVNAILAAYADEEEYPIDPLWIEEGYLMIGYNRDNVMPLHLWYDLNERTPEDALVVHGDATVAEATRDFSNFAELLVWGKAGKFRVYTRAQACDGSFKDDAYEPFVCLDPVMKQLGFHQPVAMQGRCRVYEREDATMICKGSLDDERDKFRFYRLGAPDEATIRSILGTIARETRLLVKLDAWEPPLATP
ncbi:MAG TPA: SMI1/KNR4 family protein [Polyangiales bacterium]|nr:SMI1/KNR4 family protein [Polyangiales bacterium]